MARLTEEQIAKLEKDAKLAQRREQAKRQMAQVQPAWRIKEQQAIKDYYGRMNDAHERRMQQHHNDVQSNPNAYAQSERAAAERYFQQKRNDEIRHEGYEQAEQERQTRQYIADAEKEGKIGAGSTAAQFAAEAEKHKSNNTLAGIEKQIKSQEEIERGRLEFEKWKSGEAFKNADEASKREHGYWGENGEYHPGSRERTGRVTAEGRIAAEIQRQQGRTDLQEKKNQGKLDQEKERSKGGILKALASGFGVKIKDIADLMKKEGYSDEEIKVKLEEEGITLDEGEKQKEAEKHVSTGRNVTRLINRFA